MLSDNQNQQQTNGQGILIRDLKKSYGDKTVLNGLSLFIPYGKTTCLMGKSGWGKTTLFNILMGFETPDSGQITGVPEKKSAVFQEDRLCENFSVLSNVTLPLSSSAKTKDSPLNRKVMDCLAVLGIDDAADRKVCELSGGMKRRCCLARAYLADAEFLILDEPFKGLDDQTKEAAIRLMKSFPGTILMVTHDIEEARMMEADIIRLA